MGVLLLFQGSDRFRLLRSLARLRRHFKEKLAGEVIEPSLESLEAHPAQIASPRLLGGRTLFVIQNVWQEGTAHLRKALASHLPALPDTTSLCLVDEAPARDELHQAIAAGRIFSFEPLAHAKRCRLLQKLAHDQGLRLEGDLESTLGHLDLLEAATMLETLAAYAAARPPGSTLSLEDYAHFAPEPVDLSFDLLRAVEAGDFPKAARVCHRLLRQGASSGKLIGLLTFEVRAVLACKSGLSRAAVQALGIPSFAAARAAALAPSFDFLDLARLYRRLLKLDVAAKRGRPITFGPLLLAIGGRGDDPRTPRQPLRPRPTL